MAGLSPDWLFVPRSESALASTRPIAQLHSIRLKRCGLSKNGPTDPLPASEEGIQSASALLYSMFPSLLHFGTSHLCLETPIPILSRHQPPASLFSRNTTRSQQR